MNGNAPLMHRSIIAGAAMIVLVLAFVAIMRRPGVSEHQNSSVPQGSALPYREATVAREPVASADISSGRTPVATPGKPVVTSDNRAITAVALSPIPDAMGLVGKKPCTPCDADEVSNEVWLQLSRSQDVHVLKDLTAVRRRPEAPPSLLRYQERLAGVESDDRPAVEAALRTKVATMFRAALRTITHPGGRTVFVYRDAFQCGIPPKSLLEAATEDERKTIEAAAILLKDPERMMQSPTPAKPPGGEPLRPTPARHADVPLPLSGSTHPQLESLRSLPDSDQKALLLAETYLAYHQTYPSIAYRCGQMLRGVPSPRAIDVLFRALQNGRLPEDVSLTVVELIGESRTEASVPALMSLVGTGPASQTPRSRRASVYLQQWAFRPDVLAVLTDRVMQPDAEPLHDIVRAFRGVVGGRDALAQVVREASSMKVRRTALQELGYRRHHASNASTLWALAQDENVPDELRAVALSSLRGISRDRTPEREAFVKDIAEEPTALGKVARGFDAPPAIPDEQEVSIRRLQHLLRVRRSDQRLRNTLSAKKADITTEERAILSRLDTSIAEVTAVIEAMDPDGDLRAQMGPCRDFREAQERFDTLSARREEYKAVAADPSDIHSLRNIEKELESLKHELDELDPTGRFRAKHRSEVGADPHRAPRPAPPLPMDVPW